MRLNIIGNGFDLYHGLPCTYAHFASYLAANHPDFYTQMSEMYSFRCFRSIGYDDFELVADTLFWQTFEEQLGILDSSWLMYSLQDDLGLECSEPVDLDIPEAGNSQEITDKFYEWIRKTVNSSSNFDIIRSKMPKKKIHFRKDDYFINFNYTSTLEEVYNIDPDRIMHIHGKCDPSVNWNELIVGHGNDAAIEEIMEHIRDIKSDIFYMHYQDKRNRLAEYNCRLSILKDLRKDVPHIQSQMIRLLTSKKLDIDTIRVWGLSCGAVDEPYITSLKELYPLAKWQLSYFNPEEKEKRKSFAKRMGLHQPRYFSLCNDECEETQRLIIDEHKLELLPLI